MATATLLPMARAVFFDANGNPLAGGFVTTSTPGSGSPNKITWQDAAETTPNTNPIVLDSDGSCLLYGSGAYQLTVIDSLGNQIPTYSGLTQDVISIIDGAVSTFGFIVTFPTIAALRSNAAIQPAIVYVENYHAGIVGGGGAFWKNTTDTTSGDNGGTIIVDGASNRWYREGADAAVTWTQFGAKGDGIATDTAAISAAVNWGFTSGAPVFAPSGVYLLDALVTLDSGVKLTGAGAGDNHDVVQQITAPCIARWMGTVGGTMFEVRSSTSQVPVGNVFQGIFLDGNDRRAGIGLNVLSSRLSTYEVVGTHFTYSIVNFGIDTSSGEPAGFTENLITRIAGYQVVSGDGAILTLDGTAMWDCSNNNYLLVTGDFLDGPAINIINADNEVFDIIKLYQIPGGADVGVRLNGGPTIVQCARNNTFRNVGITSNNAPVFASGTSTSAVASYENNILYLDTANNPLPPTLDTGATLWWGTVRSPTGLRSFSAASHSLVQVDTSGLITQSGVSGTIAASATGTISLPMALPLGQVLSVSVVAKTTPSACSADSGSALLTISNTGTASGGASTDFWWEVKGR